MYVSIHTSPTNPKKKLEVLAVNELGMYSLILRSNKPEAKSFQKWVYNLLKQIREALGYEQWKIKTFTETVQNHHLNMDIIKRALTILLYVNGIWNGKHTNGLNIY